MGPYYQGGFPIQGDFPMGNFDLNRGFENSFSQADFINGFMSGIFSGMMLGYFVLVGLFVIALYVLSSYVLMRLSVKTKIGRPWLAWIPILRNILWLNIGGLSGWYIFVFLLIGIPFLGWLAFLLFYIYVWIRFSVTCGKPGYLGLLTMIPMAALFLPMYLLYSEELEKK